MNVTPHRCDRHLAMISLLDDIVSGVYAVSPALKARAEALLNPPGAVLHPPELHTEPVVFPEKQPMD